MNIVPVPTAFERVKVDSGTRDWGRLSVSDGYSFTPDLWVPAIQEVLGAQTVEGAVTGFGNMALRIASLHNRFSLTHKFVQVNPARPYAIGRYRYTSHDDGSIKLGTMKSIKTDDLNIGLLSSEPEHVNAFAVVDEVKRSKGKTQVTHHEVYSRPEDGISDRLRKAGRVIAWQSYVFLNEQRPSFDLREKLDEAGVNF